MTADARLPLSRYPGMNRFVLDRLAGDEAAVRLLPKAPLRDGAPRHVDAALTDGLIASNAAWGIDARDAVEAWSEGARLFIAGQQVGVAGGPLYTLSKIATLLRMKRDAEARGERAAAFFWIATEDHDFAEVAQLALPAALVVDGSRANVQRDLVELRAANVGPDRRIVGSRPVPDSLRHAIPEHLGISPPRWLRAGITFRDSFAELIAETFGNELVLVDSLLPELRRAGASLISLLSGRSTEVQDAIATRTEEVKAAGYTPQIVARDGESYTLFFSIDANDERTPVLDTGGIAPERISTSALTRPLLQDAVLQPDVFVGGPAEVAYYAQVSALHQLAGVRLPQVALRGHALLADQRAFRAMRRLGVEPGDCFVSADELLEPAERSRVDDVKLTVAEGQAELMRNIEKLRSIALPADRSLAKSIERSIRHLEYHYRKLSERASRAVVRRDRERFDSARHVVSTLWPDEKVQERVVSWYAFTAAYGPSIIEAMIDCVGPDRDECPIVAIV